MKFLIDKRDIRNMLVSQMKTLTYISLVRPVIEYSSPVYAPYKKYNITQVEQIQRNTARFAITLIRQNTRSGFQHDRCFAMGKKLD